MAQLGGQICVNQTPKNTHQHCKNSAGKTHTENLKALVEHQNEDRDKDGAKSDDTNLFLSDFLLDMEEWTLGYIADRERPSARTPEAVIRQDAFVVRLKNKMQP